MRASSMNTRLIAAFLAIAFGAFLPLAWITLSYMRQAESDALSADGAQMTASVERMLAGEAGKIESVVRSLATMPALLDAFVARDRKRVAAELDPVHKALGVIGITALAINTPVATVLYRTNRPDFFGDDVAARRPDLVKTETTGEPTTSFSRTSEGIGLSYAVPLVVGGQRIGVFNAQIALGKALFQRIASDDGVDVVVYGVDPNGFSVIGGTVPDGVITDQSVLRGAFDTKFTPRMAQSGSAPVLVALLPIRSYDGKPLVVFELIKDRTAAATAARHTQYALLATACGILLAAIAAALLLARGIGGPIKSMIAAAQGLARGEIAEPVPGAARRDELGTLAGALEVLRLAAGRARMLEAASVEQDSRAEQDRSQAEASRAAAAAAQASVVESLAAGLARLAAGDLTCRLETPFPPDYEALRRDFNAALAELQSTLQVIVTNASSLRSGTGEMSKASDDLARRTEQQAATLEQTAAALDQITATVRKTAEGARQAREVVSTAQAGAEQSGQVVKDAIAAMAAIEDSAKQIGQIIGVIDEIAFQTNLLALNAGVEAARAGDSGRGFAVVASEVRALAQRSATAAKEIKGLIATSSKQVGTGVILVDSTGRALVQIIAQVSEINGVVCEIAASAQEQATGLVEVNSAINQMDQVTQQNAAMVEQSTACSHALLQEAEELSRLTSGFRLDETAAPGAMGAHEPRRRLDPVKAA